MTMQNKKKRDSIMRTWRVRNDAGKDEPSPQGWRSCILLLLLASLLLTGCQALPDPSEGTADGWRIATEEGASTLAVGMTETEMKNALGEVFRMEQSESCAAQGWDRIYKYPAIRIYVFVPTDQEEGWVVSFSFVTDGVWIDGTDRVTIGTESARVREMLGVPSEEAENRWVYRSGKQKLTLLFREGMISAVVLE